MEFIDELVEFVRPKAAALISNPVFKLHYVLLKWFLLVTATITASKYFGDRINCLSHKDIKKAVDAHCYLTGTFSVSNHSVATPPGPYLSTIVSDNILVHRYYQWVPYFLYLQAASFMLADMLWRYYEHNTIDNILADLTFTELKHANRHSADKKEPQKVVVKSSAERLRKLERIARYLHTRVKYCYNKKWVLQLIGCELLNTANIFLQIWFTDLLLEHRFYGLQFDDLPILFPIWSQCLFYNYGASGSIQRWDALCILPMNLMNDKLFYTMWYLYTAVACCTVLNLTWRSLQIALHSSHWFNRFVSGPGVHRDDLQYLCSLSFYDWLFFKYLAKNVSPLVFQVLVTQVKQMRFNDVVVECSNKQRIARDEPVEEYDSEYEEIEL